MNNLKLKTEVKRLITEGREHLAERNRYPSYHDVSVNSYARWNAGCRAFIRLLGSAATGFESDFNFTYGGSVPPTMLGILEHLEHALENGLLVTVEELVQAESFNSLLDQADHLNDAGYFLAAGVLARAVLEAHLRAWAAHNKIPIVKEKPTLNDYKDALYRQKCFSISTMKHIEAMAAIGNDAAHNKAELTKSEVQRLLRDVRDFIGKYPWI